MGESGLKCKAEFAHNVRGESWVNSLREENAGKVSNKLSWLSTYGNEMSGLWFFQFVPQPVKILVSSTNRIFWQVKLHPSTLRRRRRTEQNKHKRILCWQKGGKNSLWITRLNKNTLFFHQTHSQRAGSANTEGGLGHRAQLKTQGSRMKRSTCGSVFCFVFHPQEVELNYPSELCSETFDLFPPSFSLRISFSRIIPLKILLLNPNLWICEKELHLHFW